MQSSGTKEGRCNNECLISCHMNRELSLVTQEGRYKTSSNFFVGSKKYIKGIKYEPVDLNVCE